MGIAKKYNNGTAHWSMKTSNTALIPNCMCSIVQELIYPVFMEKVNHTH
jgi:hypothetical protein